MTVTWQALGTYDTGTSSCAPGYPAGLAAGDLLIIGCAFGNGNDTPLDTPSGWTFIPDSLEFGGDGGAYGTDSGNRGVMAFMRIADGTETGTVTVTNPGSGTSTRVTSAQIMRFTKTEAEFYVSASNGEDNTDGTGYSATADSVLIPANGDQGIAVTAWNPDSATAGTPTLTWDGVANTCTQAQTIASTQGADVRFLIFRRNLAGAGGSAPVFATTAGAAVTGATAFLLIHDGAASVVTVEPDDASHSHTASSPTLTQHQVLDPADASHAHTATSPTLVQHQVLAVDNATHAHAATSPTLTQHHVLDVDDAAHSHAATSPTLTQHHSLDVDDATHAHAATSPTLGVGTATVTPDNALHTHSATSPTLTQHHALTVDSSTHGHAATSPTLDVAGAPTVTPADATHAHSATSPTLTQHHALTVDDATHTHVATSPTIRLTRPTPAARTSTAVASTRTSVAATVARSSVTTELPRTSTAPDDPRTSTAPTTSRTSTGDN